MQLLRRPLLLSGLLLGLVASLAAPACAGEPCAELGAALCEGGDAEYCAQLAAWLNTRLVDPTTKEPLQGEPRAQMCAAIYKNVEIFYGYQFKAKQKLLGEPDFILASQKKAQEEARAYEEAMQALKSDDENGGGGGGGANMSD